MSLNIKNLKAKSGSVAINIKHPTTGALLKDEAGNQVQAFVFGKASKQYRDATDARLNAAIEANKTKETKDAVNLTASTIRENSVEFAALCTEKITVLTGENDVPLDTVEALVDVFADEGMYWLLDQVTAAIEADKNFF